ncbi:MAG: NUDIX domain-containing protein [Patescibacteria group bacterium]|nr:NUDIX domain-containing protein [Patescibacteria group bacterium]
MTRDELVQLLVAHHIPFETWGTGGAKTLKHLLHELESGEAVLKVQRGILTRIAEGATLKVFYRSGSDLYCLREDRQVFVDGRVKQRTLMGDMSIGEKMRPGETAEAAAIRALEEELGITERLPLIARPDLVKGPSPSISFPGIMTIYLMHAFEVYLPDRWYKPEGYVEHQEDKTNYFLWEKVAQK